MSSIKLKHASGNGVIIAAPSSNPAADRTITLPSTADGTMLTTTNPKAGNIIQVLQTVKTDTFSTTSTSATDVTGLSVSITPASASNKILVTYDVKASCENVQMSFFLVRGSTTIYVGNGDGNRIRVSSLVLGTLNSQNSETYRGIPQMHACFLDSPSTASAITYKIQCQVNSDTGYVNRSGDDADQNYRARSASSITVMEVAA